MPQNTKRSARDVVNDLRTLRSGTMPTGAKAPKAPAARPAASDPVEDRRMALATRRNQGKLKDVYLPAMKPRR